MEKKLQDHSKIVLSVVSHGQIDLVKQLLCDLEQQTYKDFRVILRKNVAEASLQETFDFPIFEIDNLNVNGFGENHNRNYEFGTSEYFIVVNPDIRIYDVKFLENLVSKLDEQPIHICGPKVVAPSGELEDSVRSFPTITSLYNKIFKHKKDQNLIDNAHDIIEVDWLAGMFLCFRKDIFRKLNGFDEKYFMYYEDVDICLRAIAAGIKVNCLTTLTVQHAARRDSHTNWYLKKVHIRSMLRYLYRFYRGKI
jgi:N-acetylglucosaminyl-diphospho-decaprenol L-rhamnosyltransferase